MKEVYWECSVLQDQALGEGEGRRERSRTGQWEELTCDADDGDLVQSSGAGTQAQLP